MSTNNMDISPKSYKCFLTDRLNFLRAGTTHGDAFNIYDTQSHLYFKIFFDFHYGKTQGNPDNCHGLLWLPADPRVNEETFPQSTTWGSSDSKELESFLTEDTAWNYLQLNGEHERAYMLRRFIQLLSDINSKSPWYFTSVSGLSEALTREQFGNNEFKIEEERKKISIKCLPDAYDNRIGTLLDLYRSIVWSHATKREIVPANLRKFDMSIYIFSDAIGKMYDVRRNSENLPRFLSLADSNFVTRDQLTQMDQIDELDRLKQSDKNIHKTNIDANATIDFAGNYSEATYKTQYIVGHKYIEFHNCEFNFNSSNTGYGELSNAEGFTPEYTIDISYDNAYERRYDEIFDMILGDFISWDWLLHNDPVDLGVNKSYKNFRDKQGKVLTSNGDNYVLGQELAIDKFFDNLVKSTVKTYLNPLATKTWAKLKSLATNNMNIGYATSALDSINKGLKTGNVADFVTAKNDIINFITDKSDKSSKYKQKEKRQNPNIFGQHFKWKLGPISDFNISDIEKEYQYKDMIHRAWQSEISDINISNIEKEYQYKDMKQVERQDEISDINISDNNNTKRQSVELSDRNISDIEKEYQYKDMEQVERQAKISDINISDNNNTERQLGQLSDHNISDNNNTERQLGQLSDHNISDNNNTERQLGQLSDHNISDNNMPKKDNIPPVSFTNKTLFESVAPEAIKELGNLYKKSNASKNI